MMLRGIKGTYLYACEPGLQKYLMDHLNPEIEETLLQSAAEEVSIIPFVNAVPLYDLKAAAGQFSEPQNVEFTNWVIIPEHNKISEEYFACHVIGDSMNRIIPNGSIALFRKYTSGSREGKIVLVEKENYIDSDFGSCYSVKEYHSNKVVQEDSWTHTGIELRPLSTNKNYESIRIENLDIEQLKVIGTFVSIIDNNN